MGAQPNRPQNSSPGATPLNARLVTVGLYALSRGEWQTVMASTHLIQERRWSYV
jgi:hypothetical protein